MSGRTMSSNYTFINSQRLGSEGLESGPYEFKSDIIFELVINSALFSCSYRHTHVTTATAPTGNPAIPRVFPIGREFSIQTLVKKGPKSPL